MKQVFLDTSSLLAYLTDSNKAQADEVERWLVGAAKGDLRLRTTTLVVVETVDVLELGFGVAREKIKDVMLGVLNSEGLEYEERDVLVQALYTFATSDKTFVETYHRVRAAI